jgi:hypothetical protein
MYPVEPPLQSAEVANLTLLLPLHSGLQMHPTLPTKII